LRFEETYIITLGKNFRIIFAILDAWHALEVFSWEEAKKTSFGRCKLGKGRSNK